MYNEEKKSFLGIGIAIILLVATSIYIYARAVGNKKYLTKWEDYDDCGIF
ncbi:MAG: hypothetical protein LBM93_11170 [Oscillospiraceae bacterium]|jgi:hypothetical protein|nr:hypothetical protein [Oscillospiraceae bacterium]